MLMLLNKVILSTLPGQLILLLGISVPAGAIKVGNDINPTSVTFSFPSGGGGLKPGYSYTLKLRLIVIVMLILVILPEIPMIQMLYML